MIQASNPTVEFRKPFRELLAGSCMLKNDSIAGYRKPSMQLVNIFIELSSASGIGVTNKLDYALSGPLLIL